MMPVVPMMPVMPVMPVMPMVPVVPMMPMRFGDRWQKGDADNNRRRVQKGLDHREKPPTCRKLHERSSLIKSTDDSMNPG